MRKISHLALAATALLGVGCSSTPPYQRPALAIPNEYKQAQGWVSAAPADAIDRGTWWTLFQSPTLNELAAAVEVSNQNVAAASAAYAQARALVAQQRAAMFPTVTLTGSANRSGGEGSARAGDNFQLGLGSSWEPDLWGRLGAAAHASSASAQASAADLASARLAAQGELVANYLTLRQLDTQRALLAQTITGYQRALEIANNRFKAGLTVKSDVLQAQTQLANAQSDQLGLARQRDENEHAIAVLLGKAPAAFSLAPEPWQALVPAVPLVLPSTLLQRRPDIAAAERRVAAANEQIGIARAAYFPTIGLSASTASASSRIGELAKASTSFWSIGLSAAETLFNAGATGARVSGAEAARDEAAARYRQTVLSALANVENQLAASTILAQQEQLRRQASGAADEAEQLMLNRYRAGQVSFTEVVTTQAAALGARRALVQAQADRQLAALTLIQALGGGWQAQ